MLQGTFFSGAKSAAFREMNPIGFVGNPGRSPLVDVDQRLSTRLTDDLTAIRERQGKIDDNIKLENRHMILLVTAK